jgi:hypothetical protein
MLTVFCLLDGTITYKYKSNLIHFVYSSLELLTKLLIKDFKV